MLTIQLIIRHSSNLTIPTLADHRSRSASVHSIKIMSFVADGSTALTNSIFLSILPTASVTSPISLIYRRIKPDIEAALIEKCSLFSKISRLEHCIFLESLQLEIFNDLGIQFLRGISISYFLHFGCHLLPIFTKLVISSHGLLL